MAETRIEDRTTKVAMIAERQGVASKSRAVGRSALTGAAIQRIGRDLHLQRRFAAAADPSPSGGAKGHRPEALREIRQFVIEYHNNLYPNTLERCDRSLASAGLHCVAWPATRDPGLLYAWRDRVQGRSPFGRFRMDRALSNQTTESGRKTHAGETPLSVSVVICTYNGTARLPQTLAHLAAQENTGSIAWEVIVVDNASTDGTAEVARRCWPPDAPAPLRIVDEPRLGLSNARGRGLVEASHEIVSFVDDDNWVADSWVRTVSELMSLDPALGAVCGLCYPVCEIEPPPWFERFRGRYAIVTVEDLAKLEGPPRALFGAGLSVRKEGWLKLKQAGFEQNLSDATGQKLLRGGDSELTHAIREAGWELRIDPRLRLEHFLPSNRLSWAYLRRLGREGAASGVLLDEYNLRAEAGLKGSLRQSWFWQAAGTARLILRHPVTLALMSLFPMEGEPKAIELENLIGRFMGLLRLRGRYSRIRRAMPGKEAARRVRDSCVRQSLATPQ
jgi:hypothetical protein